MNRKIKLQTFKIKQTYVFLPFCYQTDYKLFQAQKVLILDLSWTRHWKKFQAAFVETTEHKQQKFKKQ